LSKISLATSYDVSAKEIILFYKFHIHVKLNYIYCIYYISEVTVGTLTDKPWNLRSLHKSQWLNTSLVFAPVNSKHFSCLTASLHRCDSRTQQFYNMERVCESLANGCLFHRSCIFRESLRSWALRHRLQKTPFHFWSWDFQKVESLENSTVGLP
jgi:hypothetical protein